MAMDEWRGTDFPRDREIMIRLDLAVPAHWDASLGCWVLSHPVHVETVHRPYAWKPIPGAGARPPGPARPAGRNNAHPEPA